LVLLAILMVVWMCRVVKGKGYCFSVVQLYLRSLYFERIVYPFAAIVGQEKLKLALLLNAVNPRIGGLLIRGPKGTGKSTAVRALADLLPEMAVSKGCRFNCNPADPTNMCHDCFVRQLNDEALPVENRKMKVVSLPIGATEDRVIESLDIEKAIKMGIRALEPSILAEANQNILYVDEVVKNNKREVLWSKPQKRRRVEEGDNRGKTGRLVLL
jgi:Mg-chelatase subunit ChlI